MNLPQISSNYRIDDTLYYYFRQCKQKYNFRHEAKSHKDSGSLTKSTITSLDVECF